MRYDPHWENKDFLQERAKYLEQSHQRLVKANCPSKMTFEEARHYHWLLDLHRIAANKTFSHTYWIQLKAQKTR